MLNFIKLLKKICEQICYKKKKKLKLERIYQKIISVVSVFKLFFFKSTYNHYKKHSTTKNANSQNLIKFNKSRIII